MTARCCNYQDDEQCARCGSSMAREQCGSCSACGHWDEPDPSCPFCKGTGFEPVCLSSHDWCNAHPLPDRENVKPSTPEPFRVHQQGCPSGLVTELLPITSETHSGA